MDRERWRKIEAICETALELPEHLRGDLVEKLCAEDSSLRPEVEALLAQSGKVQGFLEVPVWQDGSTDSTGEPTPPAPMLPPGTRLGPYEVVAPLGAGGMGAVYEGRDTRLGRTVALKLLPESAAADPDRRRRFEQEARAVAALNHPHICTLYDFGQTGSVSYLVMEHVRGETLSARLERGPLPVALACQLGAQVADALASAHRQGIVHRDLKPGNVMLTAGPPGSGGVPSAKLLDFGLAKLTGHGEQALLEPDDAGRASSGSMTGRRGSIIGTLPYMAPEQLEGKPADSRTDLWALGAVLYRMTTGRQPFEGDSAVTLIGNILNAEPTPLVEAQPLAPPAFDRLVRKCLAKSPDDRWDSARDVADELRWIATSLADQPRRSDASVPAATPEADRWRTTAWLAIAAVAVLAAGAARSWWTERSATPRFYQLDTRPADGLSSGISSEKERGANRPSRISFALSPDGQWLVFSGSRDGRQLLWRRRLAADEEAHPITGTDDAYCPFFSPDGRWIGFAAGDAVKKVPIDGGASQEICKTDLLYAASWGPNGEIVLDENLRKFRLVSERGGTPRDLRTRRNLREAEALPHFLPDGRRLLFVRTTADIHRGSVWAMDLATGTQTKILDRASNPHYLVTGHLAYLIDGSLYVVPFDLDRLRITGAARAIASNVMQASNSPNATLDTGAGQFAFSASGTLAYVEGGVLPDMKNDLVWVDRQGRMTERLAVEPGAISGPRVSPDGRKVLYHDVGGTGTIWVYDIAHRDRKAGFVSKEPELRPFFPIWTPDGRGASFAAPWPGVPRVYTVELESTAAPRQAPAPPADLWTEWPGSWTPDGELLIAEWGGDPPALSYTKVRPDMAGATRQLLFNILAPQRPKGARDMPRVSPDGRWLAYSAQYSGEPEVYIRRFPGLQAATPVSRGAGRSPAWRGDSKALYYVRPAPPALMEVTLTTGPRLVWQDPVLLFELPTDFLLYTQLGLISRDLGTGFDVAHDGQRFVFVRRLDMNAPPPPRHINVIENWPALVRGKQ